MDEYYINLEHDVENVCVICFDIFSDKNSTFFKNLVDKIG